MRSQVQRRLKDDINTIHNTYTTLAFADKTSNLYKFKKEQYNKMLNDLNNNNQQKGKQLYS